MTQPCLYDLNDLNHTLPLFHPQPDNQWIPLKDDIRVRFRKNSHIPGAAFIELEIRNKRLVFSGDIGRPGDPMLGPPERPNIADVLLIESTYGGKVHSHESSEQILKDIIQEAIRNNGIIIIPSFTVDRAQDFMYLLWKLREKHLIPGLPVYLDSPMGINVNKIFLEYPEWHKLGEKTIHDVFKSVNLVRSIDETLALADDTHPKIIIAGSGMMNGGRILHYLCKHISNPLSTIIIPGYQAEGTRGRMLLEAAQEIKIHGTYYEVKATVKTITTMSSHADQNELLDWVSSISKKPEQVFIVHGEPQSANTLRVKLKDSLGWQCTIPHLMDQFWINVD